MTELEPAIEVKLSSELEPKPDSLLNQDLEPKRALLGSNGNPIDALTNDATVVRILNRPSRIIPDIWVPLGMCSVMLSGIPALLIMVIYRLSHLSNLVGFSQISDAQLFFLLYAICFGAALPFLAIITGICATRNFDRQVLPEISIDKNGVRLPPSIIGKCIENDHRLSFPPVIVEKCVEQGKTLGLPSPIIEGVLEACKRLVYSQMTGRLIKAFCQTGNRQEEIKGLRGAFQNKVISWDEIIGVEYRFSGDTFRQPKLRINTSYSEGHRHYYEIDLLTLSEQDRKSVCNALCRWAPERAAWAQNSKAYLPNKAVTYTELWLDSQTDKATNRTKVLFVGETANNGKYKVIEALVGGGQANVYLADDLANANESPVVLKEFILPIEPRSRMQSKEAYSVECEILRKLSHPGIVRLLDSFEENDRACLVLEYVRGKSLASLIDQDGCLNSKDGLRLAISLAKILKHLHGLSSPIVHRDFTPHNLIVSGDLRTEDLASKVTLIDFASSLQKSEAELDQKTGTVQKEEVAGTIAYMAPEQFRGRATCQSDIYSFGATLYFVLTGIEPEPLKRLSPLQQNKSISASLDSIVSRATEQELRGRYKDIDELLAELLAIDPS